MKLQTIGLSLALVLLLGCANTAEEDQEARMIHLIEKLGGRIKRDESMDNKPIIAVDLSHTKVTNKDLEDLKEVKTLQSLDLSLTAVTGAGLKELKGLNNLKRLELMNTQVTDAGLTELKELKSLQELYLNVTEITDKGVRVCSISR